MKSITKQKPLEEIKQQLDGLERAYIVGCGTCATMTKTGGRDEVMAMKECLQGLGKMVTGWTVIPTACDGMTEASMRENNGAIRGANCVLVMSCALGVQRVGSYIDKPLSRHWIPYSSALRIVRIFPRNLRPVWPLRPGLHRRHLSYHGMS